MNAPTRFAQVTGATGSKPVKVLKIEKPTGGQALTVEASYDGTVKVDFGAIANEKITLVHIGEKLIILFDNQSTVTIIPFFDSMGVPLANISIESNGKEFSGQEFATTFPITTDQSVLPAAGEGGPAGTPASGANFANSSVDPLASPDPLPLLGPEELPGIQFTRIQGADVNGFPEFELLGPMTGLVEEEQFLVTPPNSDAGVGNEDLNDNLGLDTDEPGSDVVTLVTTGNLATIVGGAMPPFSFSLENLVGEPVFDTGTPAQPITSIGDPVVYRNFTAGPPTATIEGWTDPDGEGVERHVFTLELNTDGTFTFTLVDTIDHPIGTEGNGDGTQEETLFIDLSDAVRVTDSVGQTAVLGDLIDVPVFTVGVIDDTPIADLVPGEFESVAVDETVNGLFADAPGSNAAFNDETASGVGTDIGFAAVLQGTVYSDHSRIGADLPGSINYALVVGGGNSGLRTSVTDQQILLAKDNVSGDIIGYVGNVSPNQPGFLFSSIAFRFHIDNTTGDITLSQFKAIKHDTAGDFGTAAQDEAKAMAAGLIAVQVHIEDGDDDSSTDTIDIGSRFQFEDDGIFVNVFRAEEEEGEGSGTVQIEPPTIDLDESIDSANDGFNPDSSDPEDLQAVGESANGNGDLDDVNGVTEPSLLTAANSSLAIGTKSTPVGGDGSISSLFGSTTTVGTDGENASARTAKFSWSLFGDGAAGANGVETTLRVTALDATAVAGPDNAALENLAADPAARTIWLYKVSDTEIVGKIGHGTLDTSDDFIAVRFLINEATGQITVEQYLPFEHPDNTANFDESLVLAFASNGQEIGPHLDVTYTVRVQDNDGDFDSDSESVTLASTNSQGGSFVFDDDGPTVDVGNETTSGTSGSVPLTLAQLNLDETFDIAPPANEDRYVAGETQDNNGDLDDVGVPFSIANLTTVAADADAFGKLSTKAGAGQDEGDLGDLFTGPVANFGTDGPALNNALTQEFTVELGGAGANGQTPTGVKTTLVVTAVDGSPLEGMSAANRTIYLFEENGVIVGRIGHDTPETTDDYVALKIYVENPTDPVLAKLTVEQIIPLEHPTTTLHDEQIALALVGTGELDNPTLTVKLTVTATDGDGDTVTDSAQVLLADENSNNENAAITFDDDGPTVTAESTCDEVPPIPAKDANFVLVLDSSGSVDGGQLTLIQQNAINFINAAKASGAENLRIHIVDFNDNSRVVGTFDLIINGEIQDGGPGELNQVQAAIDAIEDMDAGGSTNYEAGLAQAKEWIEGDTVNVTNAHRFETNNDDEERAFVLTDANGVRIAVVSGWNDNDISDATNDQGNDSTAVAGGFGVGGNDNINDDNLLRVDFGAFNDFGDPGEFGLDGEAEGFRGSDVTAATFLLNDNNDTVGGNTTFAGTIYFVGGGSQNFSYNVDGSQVVELKGTVAPNVGKLIAYIEFEATSGQGVVDLQSVVIGTGPIPGAEVNKVIFFSDGEPNHQLENDGDVDDTSTGTAVSESLDEVTAIQNAGFDVEAFGAGANGAGITVLNQIDTGNAENVTTNTGLAEALDSLLDSLAGVDQDCPPIVIHDETPGVQSGIGGTNANDQDDVADVPPAIFNLFAAVAAPGNDPDVADVGVSEDLGGGKFAIGFARSGTDGNPNAPITFTPDYGTDGPHATNPFSFALGIPGGMAANGTVDSGLDTTDGKSIYLFQQADGLIVGRIETDGVAGLTANDQAAFAIAIDPVTGEIFVAQYLSIDHPLAGNGEGGTFDELVTLAEGVVLATVTLRDGDNDVVTSNAVDIGDRIGFSDDGPTSGTVSVASGSALIHDETPGDDGDDDVASSAALDNLFAGVANKGDDPHVTGSGPIGYAQDTFSITPSANYGADGQGAAVQYSLTISATNALSGLQTTDGKNIRLVKEGAIIVGRVDFDGDGSVTDGEANDDAAFAIHVDPATGQLTVAQYLSIKHDDINDFDEANDDGTNAGDDAPDQATDPVQQFLTTGTLSLTATFTDGDGDTTTASADISNRIVFEDDGPTSGTVTVTAGTLIHDETPGDDGSDDVGAGSLANLFTNVGNKGEDLDVPGSGPIGYAQDTFSITPSVTYGADGQGPAVQYSLTVNSLPSGLQTTEGKNILLVKQSDGVIVGRVDADTDGVVDADELAAFAIHVNAATGQLTLVQYLSIKHDDRGDSDESNDNGTNTNDDQNPNDTTEPVQQFLATGSLSLTATFTDGDGDFRTASTDISNRIIFEDDGPTSGTVSVATGAALIHDETPGDDGDDDVASSAALDTLFAGVANKGEDLDVPGTGPIGYAQDAFSITSLATYGADGQGAAVQYSLMVAANALSGLQTTDGKNIRLVKEGAIIVGRVDFQGDGSVTDSEAADVAAFAIHVDPATGQLTLVQYLSIKHDDRGDSDESNDNGTNTNDDQNPNDTTEPVQQALTTGSLSLTATFTDGDGDTTTASTDISARVRFEDDGPTGGSITITSGTLIHDETAGDNGDDDVDPGSLANLFTNVGNKGDDPDVSGSGPIGYAQDTFAITVTPPNYGADGQGPAVQYSLTVNSLPSGLQTTDGKNILLVKQSDGVIVGRVDADTDGVVDANELAAFAIHVNAATGQLTLVQYLSIKHDDRGDFDESNDDGTNTFDDQNPNDVTEPVQQFLATGTLSLTATFTDGDGDTTTASADISNRIIFEDDGPTVDVNLDASTAELNALKLELDETFGTDRYNGAEAQDNNGASDDTINGLPLTVAINPVAGDAIGTKTTNVVNGLGALFSVTAPAYGADGPLPGSPAGAPTDRLSFNIVGDGKTNLVVTALDNTALEGLSAASRTIYLVKLDTNSDGTFETIEGRIPGTNGTLGTGGDDFVAFRVTIQNPNTPATAQLKVDQFLAIDHDATDTNGPAVESPSVFDESMILQMVGAGGALQLVRTVTATDGDGDQHSDSASVELASTGTSILTFDDDGPKVTAEAACEGVPAMPAQDANFVLVLDSSGSVDGSEIALIKANAINFLNELAASGAQNVRVHIVDFDTNSRVGGTFDLIVNGVVQDGSPGDALGNQLQAALNAINALAGGGSTNYEAGLAQAKEWVEGGTVNVTNAHPFDADTDNDGNDTAFVLTDANGVRIAVVSGWNPTGSGTLVDLEHSEGDSSTEVAGAFGIDTNPNGSDDNLNGNAELLRFDFGAFDDRDGAGEFGLAGEAEGFRGSDVSAATFLFDDNNSNNSVNGGETRFAGTIYFVGGGSEAFSHDVSGDESIELKGTIAPNIGKLIAYIEITAPLGLGDVDLTSVVIGTGPILGADVNKVIFFSDGEPNTLLESDGDVDADDVSTATAVTESSDEITAIQTDNDAGGPNQAFTIDAFGANANASGLAVLTQIDTDPGNAPNITTTGGLSVFYADLIDTLGGSAAVDCPPIVIHDETPGVQSGTGGTNANDQDDVAGVPTVIFNLFAAVATPGNDPDVADVVAGPGDLGGGNFAIGFARSGAGNSPIEFTPDFGTDGPHPTTPVTFKLGIPGGTAANGTVDSGLDTTDGKSIFLFQQADGLIVGRIETDGVAGLSANDQAAFAIAMDPATGELFVAQFLSIKHPLAGNGSGETFDEMLVLADGAVLATVTVMDGDGDTVTSNAIAIGDKIAFQDDGPTLDVTAATGTALNALVLNVDETDDAAGTDRTNPMGPEATDNANPDGNTAGTAGLGTVTTNVGGGLTALFTLTGSVGADGASLTNQSLKFLFTQAGPLATNLTATGGGAIELVLSGDGLTITGRDTADASTVFTIKIVDVGGGVMQLELTQLEAINHDAAPGVNEATDLFDEVVSLLTSAGAVQLQYAATRLDGDGDTATDTAEINLITTGTSFFSFDDDGPTLDVTAATGTALNALVLNVDETDDAAGTDRTNPVGPEATDNANPDGNTAGTAGLGTVTTNVGGTGLSSLFTITGNAGSDGQASLTGGLKFLFTQAGPLATNLTATGGGAIELVLSGDGLTITGRDTADASTVFTIAIVDVGAGVLQLRLTQLEAIDHDAAPGLNEATDLFDEVVSLLTSTGAVQLQYSATRTDGDGDAITDTAEINLITTGTSFFSFDDDGPALDVTAATGTALNALVLNVDETDDAAGTDRTNPVGPEATDNANPDGNTAGTAGLGTVTTNVGGTGLSSLFTITGNAGSDGQASLTGGLKFLFTQAGPLATNLTATGGGAIELVLSGDGQTITGRDTADASTVFTIAIVDVGAGVLQLRLTQLEAINHDAAPGVNEATDLFDEVVSLLTSTGAVQLQYSATRTDGDGDAITDTAEINLITTGTSFFSFDDDGPTLDVTAATGTALNALVLNVDETDDAAGTDRTNPVGPEATDNANPDGNTAGTAGLGTVTTNVGGTGLSSLFTITGNAGSDGQASLTGGLKFLFTQAGPLATNLTATGGGAIELVLSGDGLTITGRDTADASTVFTIAIVDVGAGVLQLRLTQLEAIDHDAAPGLNEATDLFDEVVSLLTSTGAVQLQYSATRTDGDGDAITDTAEINLITTGTSFFSFDDDGPTLDVTAATGTALNALTLNVDETDDAAGTDRTNPVGPEATDNANPDGNTAGTAGLGTVTTNVGGTGLSSLFTITGNAGSDGQASLTGGLKFLFTQAGPLATNLTATGGGAIELVLSGDGLTITGRDTADASTVFTIAIVDVGAGVLQLRLTQLEAIDHDAAPGLNEATDLFDEVVSLLTSTGAVQLQYSATRTDGDGDAITDTAEINLITTGTSLFSFDDDGPTANSSQTLVVVDEDDIPAGITGGLGDATVPDTDGDGNESTNIGTLAGLFSGGADGIKSLDLALNTGAVSVVNQLGATIPLTSDGAPVSYFWDTLTGTLYGSTDATNATTAEATKVFTVVLEANGDYSVKLWQQVDHPLEDDPSTVGTTEISYEDNLTLSLTYRVTDGDNDAATGSFQLMIDDDTPIAIDPDAMSLDNAAGQSATAFLDIDDNIDNNVGADQVGTVSFANIAPGQDSGLTSGGAKIFLYSFGGVLVGTTQVVAIPGTIDDISDLNASLFSFKITLNHNTAGTDSYTTELFDTIDNGAGVSFADLSGGEAGNAPFKIVESTTLDALEILFTPINENNVNSDEDDVGVGSQFMEFTEGVRIDFGNFTYHDNGGPATNDGFTINSHTPSNGFKFTIDQISTGTIADVLIRALNADVGLPNQTIHTGPVPANFHNFGNDTLIPVTKVQIFNALGVSLGIVTADTTIAHADEDIVVDFLANGTVTITGLRDDYSVLTHTAAPGFERLEISNNGTGGDDGKFSLRDIQLETVTSGQPLDLHFDLALTDNDGDTIIVEDALAITLEVTTPPLAAPALSGVVEEEHLQPAAATPGTFVITASGNEDVEDAAGNDTDEGGLGTILNTKGGTLTATGGDGSYVFSVTVINDAPVMKTDTFALTSGGAPVLYHQLDADTVIGYVNSGLPGYESGEKVIFSLDVASNGTWSFKLYDKVDHPTATSGGPATEESIAIDLGGGIIKVTDGVLPAINVPASITVIDDVPLAQDDNATVEAGGGEAPSFHLTYLIDVSASISAAQMDTALEAFLALTQAYIDGGGNFSIEVIRFRGEADPAGTRHYDNFGGGGDPVGNLVTLLTNEIASQNVFAPGTVLGSGTNYEAGLNSVEDYLDAPALVGDGFNNVFYFFTDGDPTEGAIQSAANMTSYLTNSGLGALINALDVEVHAFGVGSVTAGGITILDVIDNTDASPINIVDFEDLESALLGTVGDLNAVTGKVLLGSNNVVGGGDDDSFGADGGRILSIEIDGIVYTYDAVEDEISNDDNATVVNGSVLVVDTQLGGEFTFNFAGADAGEWEYTPPASLPAGDSESFKYTLIDGDGDTTSADINIDVTVTVNDPPDAVANVINGLVEAGFTNNVTTGVGGLTAGTSTVAAVNVLTNDTDPGDTLKVTEITPQGGSTTAVPNGGSVIVQGVYGTLTIASNGTTTYNLDNTLLATQALTANQPVSDIFTYKVADSGSLTDTAQITVNITGTNDAPVIWAPAVFDYLSGATPATPLNTLKFADVDSTGNVTVALGTGDTGSAFAATSGDGVTVGGTAIAMTLVGTIAAINAFLAAGRVTYNMDDDSGDTITVSINDGASGTDTQTFTVNNLVVSGSGVDYPDNEIFNVHETLLDYGNNDDNVTTAWNDVTAGGAATEYEGGAHGGTGDTIRVVFTPDQLNEILNFGTQQNALRTFLGTPSSDLDLNASSWNATVDNFEVAHLGLAAVRDTSGSDNYLDLDTWDPIPTAVAVGAGTAGANLIVGTAAGQTLNGLAGNDVLAAFHTGANTLNGGDDSDLLLGGDGNDVLNGGSGVDILAGGKGADTFKSSNLGNTNRDTILDYDFTEGDALDLSDLLNAAFDPGDNINNFIQVTTVNTNDLLVRVDQTGSGTFGTAHEAFLLAGAATNSNDPLRAFFDGTNHVVTG